MTKPNEDPISFFWDKFSENDPKGRRLIRLKDRSEIELLYRSGFVDADQFGLEEWADSFRESRQKDGSYLVTEAQWAEKRKYIYAGPVEAPLDPLQLREGEWDQKEFEALIMEKILPEILADHEEVKRQFDLAATQAMGGRAVVNQAFKIAVQKALDLHPSPRRLRELAFVGLKSGGRPLMAVTGFSSGPSESQAAQDRLSRLLSKEKS